MDEKLKRHQFVHVTSVEEEEEEIDDKTFINGNCEIDNDNDNASDSVPLGLSGKAVCIQVGGRSLSKYINTIEISGFVSRHPLWQYAREQIERKDLSGSEASEGHYSA